jgi:hypothetical protein
MRRKLFIVLLLGAALEVAWLYGGLDLIRSKTGTGPVDRPVKEANQVKPSVEQAREVVKADPAALGKALLAASPPIPGDPSRDPFALPSGVRLLADVGAAQAKAEGEAAGQELAKAAPPARQLNGILVGPRDRFAIIDGTLVRSGDSLEGERIVGIERDHVVLARDGQQRTLRLPPPFPELSPATEQGQTRSSAGESQPKRPNGVKER